MRLPEFIRRLNLQSVAPPVVVGIIGVVIYLPKLGARNLEPIDEGIYANIALNMIEKGDWLIPTLNRYFNHAGEATIWLQKPPLSIWLQAVSMSAFGKTLFATRLPSALSAIAIGVLVCLVAYREWNWLAGLVAGCVAITAEPLMMYGYGGFYAVTDTQMVLFGSAFVYCSWRALRESPRYFYAAGVFGGLAAMSKGVAAGQFLIILAPIVILNYRSALTREAAIGAGIAIAIYAPWHIAAFTLQPDAFVGQYIEGQVLSRSAGALGTTGNALLPTANFPYIKYALKYVSPGGLLGLGYYSALIAAAAFTGLHRSGWRLPPMLALCWWWAAAIPITFSLVGGNQPHYLMPMTVPLALLIGVTASWLAIVVDNWTSRPLGKPAFVTACLLSVIVLVAILSPPVLDVRPTGTDQAEMADVINHQVTDDVVYYSMGMEGEHRLLPTDFYTEKKLAPHEVGERSPDGWLIAYHQQQGCEQVWEGNLTEIQLLDCRS
ncbi:ArnT family glycosyltransferase [Halobacterium hubeiense]|uniref:ArnT family glycosyltransferase n=1 Tax=Halobacterium hubeiense TaxID=1407499 RepID=UPI000B7C8735|nr:glycosyltransferase family 39 protein [Halobacterium hubeiense]